MTGSRGRAFSAAAAASPLAAAGLGRGATGGRYAGCKPTASLNHCVLPRSHYYFSNNKSLFRQRQVGASGGAPPPIVYYGKYPEELELAAQHATALRLRGARYVGRQLHGRPAPAPGAPPTVGHADAAWRPATVDAAEAEAAIWRHAHINAAVYGISAPKSALPAFLEEMRRSYAWPTFGLSTLIRWDG